MLEVRQLADEGRIKEVIDEVNRLNPHFFEHSPQHLFQLKQVGGNCALPHDFHRYSNCWSLKQQYGLPSRVGSYHWKVMDSKLNLAVGLNFVECWFGVGFQVKLILPQLAILGLVFSF